MTRSVLIFTFSPVQPFIAQARRAADLYSGSQILVELARAAAMALQNTDAKLIYPASQTDDAPNRLVAIVQDVDQAVQAAETGFKARWQELTQTAKVELSKYPPTPDAEWEKIWQRQTNNLWEIYWSAAEMNDDDFHRAYENARHALEATKRTRAFEQVNEDGLKDTLSGERSALRVGGEDAREYWKKISTRVSPSKLKPEGRERLDAIGAVKRFGKLDEDKKQILPFNGFPSTSTIATLPYLNRCREYPNLLEKYAQAVKALGCFEVRGKADWQYDGDLFFSEMLDPRRLKEDYNITKTEAELADARDALNALYKEVGRPPAYYAILALDGDNMGKRINACQSLQDAEKISKSLNEYAQGIRVSMEFKAGREPDVYVIYNGGDDLLAMAPLEKAFETAEKWQRDFKDIVQGTASAGIAIVHHQAQLSASLRAARTALEHAKKLDGKDAVCIQVLKRSGEPVEILSHWQDVSELFASIKEDFSEVDGQKTAALSSKFAYSVLEEAGVLNALPSEAREAALKRLLRRHKQGDLKPKTLAKPLAEFASLLDQYHAKKLDEINKKEISQGMTALGNWLVAIRFIAQGGGE